MVANLGVSSEPLDWTHAIDQAELNKFIQSDPDSVYEDLVSAYSDIVNGSALGFQLAHEGLRKVLVSVEHPETEARIAFLDGKREDYDRFRKLAGFRTTAVLT